MHRPAFLLLDTPTSRLGSAISSTMPDPPLSSPYLRYLPLPPHILPPWIVLRPCSSPANPAHNLSHHGYPPHHTAHHSVTSFTSSEPEKEIQLTSIQRDQPASPQRSLPPLSSISGGPSASGSRMALSSLLTSAPPPPILGGSSNNTPSRASHAVHARGTSPSPPPAVAGELARAPIHSLDYAPASAGSQVFYGAPPGYSGSAASGREAREGRGGREGRERARRDSISSHSRPSAAGLTPSYASSHMYDNGAYDDYDRREGRRTVSGASSKHSYGHHGNGSRHGSGSGHENGHGYYDPLGASTGARAPLSHGNSYSHSQSATGITPSYAHLDESTTPPRIPPPLSLLDPLPRSSAGKRSRGYSSTRDTSPPPPSARGEYPGTRSSTSRSPVRARGYEGEMSQGRTIYGDSRSGSTRRGSDYDGYASAAYGHPLEQRAEGVIVAAPASARDREVYEVPRPRSSRSNVRDPYARRREIYEADHAPPSARDARRRSEAEDGLKGEVNGAGAQSGSQSPSKTTAYKLSDLLTESRPVWGALLTEFQHKREREVKDIETLDLDVSILASYSSAGGNFRRY